MTAIFPNSPNRGGGAIINHGVLSIRRSTFSDNFGGVFGGAMPTVARSRWKHSVVAGNSATFGGGIYNAGTLVAEHSIITQNEASVQGGGIYNCVGGVLLLEACLGTLETDAHESRG